jgi:hypothetical protein
MNEEMLRDLAAKIAGDYQSIFGPNKSLSSWLSSTSSESPPEHRHEDDPDDDGYEPSDDDIVDRLRQNTPCIACRQTCEEAAMEIERLRLKEEPFTVDSSDILLKTNVAIFNMDPCGSPECVTPGVHFLQELRSEICRLRKVEAKAKSLAAAARKVWRGEPMSLLIHAAMSFEEVSP